MIMMPICESSEIAKPLEKNRGSTRSSRTVTAQATYMPRSMRRNSTPFISALPGAHQAARGHEQKQDHQQVGKHQGDLGQRQRPDRIAEGVAVDLDADLREEVDAGPVEADRERLEDPDQQRRIEGPSKR